MSDDVLIRGKQLVCRADTPPVAEAALLARNGIIVAVGKDAEERGGGAEVIDLSSFVLAPGLIDSHVHLIWSGGQNAILGAIGTSRTDFAIQAVANMQAALSRGITTVRDCGGIVDVVVPLARAVDDGRLVGPRIVTCGSPITTTAGHCWYLETEADGVIEVQKAVRRMHGAGADFIKAIVTGGGSTPGTNPSASQYSQEELCAISEDSHRLGHCVTGHAHGTEGILRSIQAAFDGIEHCTWLARDEDDEDYRPDAVERIIADGVYVCKTIAGFQRWPIDELGPRHAAWRKYETMRSMVEAGVSLIAGTDGGINGTNFTDLCLSLETMMGLGGMTAAAAFTSATETASRALELEDQIGTLEPGKRADCIALDENPVENIRVLRHPRAVVRGGCLVAREGRLLI